MQSAKRGFLFWAVLVAAMVMTCSAAMAQKPEAHRYAVVFEESEVANPGELARSQVAKRDGRLLFIYRHALEGYAAVLTEAQAEALKDDPRVDFVARDRRVEAFGQTIPTGIDRVFATANKALDIDGVDDVRVNADVAVLDTGVDVEHPDLNVVAATNCLNGTAENPVCVDGSASDVNGHGTHVTGTVGALDNGIGIVGVAPGARIRAVKVLNEYGMGWDTTIAAGINWATATRTDSDPSNDVEVLNMSLGCQCELPLTMAAVTGSVEKGIVNAVAAGNSAVSAGLTAPAKHPDVITVSALADSDGDSGGQGEDTCWDDLRSFFGGYRLIEDDTLAPFSSRGTAVEVAAPGVCILSTRSGGGYGTATGTSMASPHVAGAAAVLAAKSQPKTKADVEAIRSTIEAEGNLNWTDTSGDSEQEPLLDLGDGSTVATKTATVLSAGEVILRGLVDPGGLSTKYQFEYGTSTAYGSKVPLAGKDVGSGAGYVKVSQAIEGLKKDTVYHYRLTATNSSGTFHTADRVFATNVPTVSTGQAKRVGSMKANLTATVNPQGAATRYYFQYGTSTSYGSYAFPEKYKSIGAGTEAIGVSLPVARLEPSTTYHFRVVAHNEHGVVHGEDRTFTTPTLGAIRVLDPGFGEPCSLHKECPIAVVEGRFFSDLATFFTPPSECLHTYEMRFKTDGTLRLVDHELMGECHFKPCPGEAEAWEGKILSFDNGLATARIDVCLEWFAGSQIKEGSIEVEFRMGAGFSAEQFEITAPFQSFHDAGFEAEWLMDGYAEIIGMPATITDGATAVEWPEATLHGTVNPNGGWTDYQFEYGTTTAYGAKAPSAPAGVNEGKTDTPVQQTIKGLEPNTTYHYRVVATSELGTTYGQDETFTTGPAHVDGDVDGDARVDLVTLETDGTVRTFEGTESGIAAGEATTSLPPGLDPALLDGVGHYLVDVADVTGDGHSDLVTMRNTSGAFVFAGSGSGGFSTTPVESLSGLATNLDGSGGFEPIAAADVNGDDRADLVGFGGFGTLLTYLGQADGTFTSIQISGTRNSALFDAAGDYFLDVADVTGDGLADVVSMNTSGTTSVSKGQSGGGFAAAQAAATINPIMDDGSGHEPIGLGDVNADGRADLLTLDGTTLKLWVGQANATFAAATNPYAGTVNSDLTDGTGEELVGLLDHNRDGRSDLVSLNSEGDVKTYAAQSGSPATFASPATHAGSIDTVRGLSTPGQEVASEKPLLRRAGCGTSGCRWHSKPAEADVNGDGRSDLVSVHTDASARVFAAGGAGIEAASPTTSLVEGVNPALLDSAGEYVIDASDVSGDGRSDLVTIKAAGGVRVYRGGADRKFGAASESLAVLNPYLDGPGNFEPIAVADVNGDGRADLVGFGGFGTLLMYPGQAAGTFGGATASATPNSALRDGVGDYFLDVVDVTGDGLADLVTMNTNGTTYVLKGQSGGEFAAAQAAATINPMMDDGSGHEPIGLGDVNADGRADLLTLDGATLKLWAGQAAGTFAAATNPYAGTVNSDLTDGTGEELVGLLDYNRDGRSDLVSLNSEGDVRTYAAQSGSPATFAAPQTHAGSIDTVRGGVTPGHEPASEKPFFRRAGCTASGCDW